MTQIAEVVSSVLETEAFDANRVAEAIAQRAFEDSLKEDFDSPFAQEARKFGYRGYMGGKSDDISVTVGRVQINAKPKSAEQSDSPAAEEA